MEKELAKRLAEKAARGELDTNGNRKPVDDRFVAQADLALPVWKGDPAADEPAPDSGVRSSVSALANVDDDPARPLTYSMYTVSELEDVRRSRLSMALIAEPQPLSWRDVARSAHAVLRAFGSWARAPKPRPRLMDVCRVPLTALGADLRAALGRLPWKKVAWAMAFTAGALALLLFAVITVAELTDDVKPKPATSRSRFETTTSTTEAKAEQKTEEQTDVAAQPTAAPVARNAEPASAKKAEPAPAQIEIDDEEPASAKPAPAAKTKPAKKVREAELFIP
jgi:hypothetical protein